MLQFDTAIIGFLEVLNRFDERINKLNYDIDFLHCKQII